MLPEKNRVERHQLPALVRQKVPSKRAHRVLDYLLVNDVALTPEISRDCAVGNVSDAACLLRPVLYPLGWTIAANLPDPPLRNRYGEITRVHEWRLVPLR